ncbi:hypothetical protein [Tsukamurella sp. PLM1]|uniref:SbtR family transcriptional regulator n=1 Tax=Tsukamurella sp. PLM1 TaxID=2929795 RepID=UPI00353007B1
MDGVRGLPRRPDRGTGQRPHRQRGSGQGAVGEVDIVAECGRAGGAVLAVLDRAHTAGVVRPDFGFDDLATLMVAVANVIALNPGDDVAWRRHLGFVLDGVRNPRAAER